MRDSSKLHRNKLHKNDLLSVLEVGYVGVQNLVTVWIFEEIDLFVLGLDKFKSVTSIILCTQ